MHFLSRLIEMARGLAILCLCAMPASAATLVFTATASEPVIVTGTPRIAIDVGGATRFATYASGSGTAALTFSYAVQAGDFDANGITIAAPLDLNGGSITDIAGNPASSLTFTVPDTSALKVQTYTATFTTSPITNANASAVSFAIAKAPTGASFTYTITSSGGSGSVTGSGTIGGSPHTVSNVDVSALPTGTLTLSVTVSTAAGGTGAAKTVASTPSFTGVLDSLPASAAAFSVRRLRSGYSGSLLRVRRSSDNTEQNIGFTIGGHIDTAALTGFCGSNSCFISTWYDQSGNGRNAVQATAANQPRIVNAGSVDMAGGRPGLIWPSVTNTTFLGMTAQFFAIGAVSAVAQYGSGTQTGWIASYAGLFGGAGPAPPFFHASLLGSSFFYHTLAFDNWARNGAQLAASANAIALPWPLATVYATAPTSQNYRWSIGSDRMISGRGWSGPISEFVMLPSALSTSDRQILERGQGSYYGVSVP
ncbi:MAG: arabinofuranosidase catalytic domain-containing protein [Aestuariivirga sp.]|uniref:arabinofuranosidase catalytic domain-containing protein n=1 Tax=Aestuariivirga sp. TaxID=2650926 RepID=UPI0030196705